MKHFVRLVFVLGAMCGGAWAQDAASPNLHTDPNAQWLSELLMPYGGLQEFQRSMESIRPELEKPATVNRLVQLGQQSRSRDLSGQQQPPAAATEAAMHLLSFAKTDSAVDAIAPYLSHESPQVRVRAAEDLRVTENPRAVPPLKLALLDLERQLPGALVPDPGTEALLKALMTYFRSLSMIRGDEALVALDASLTRLKAKYGNSDVGRELLRQLEHIRETGGIQEYRASAAASSVPPTTQPSPDNAPLPATPVPSAPPTALPPSATPIAQVPATPVEQRAPVWPWLIGIAAAAGIALLVWKWRA